MNLVIKGICVIKMHAAWCNMACDKHEVRWNRKVIDFVVCTQNLGLDEYMSFLNYMYLIYGLDSTGDNDLIA